MQAALFDLDGVLLDTEPQYTLFWGQMGREYLPEVPHFEQRIKGQTLVQIFERWFASEDDRRDITRRLDAFERSMRLDYIPGALEYLRRLQREGVATAIVTSSNRAKMSAVYRAHPELSPLLTQILTSEDFAASKPSPDCYLTAALRLGADIRRCTVYEDSRNGLLAGRASGAHVVALATTLPREELVTLADEVIDDFQGR